MEAFDKVGIFHRRSVIYNIHADNNTYEGGCDINVSLFNRVATTWFTAYYTIYVIYIKIPCRDGKVGIPEIVCTVIPLAIRAAATAA
jgi:hypothetical protein